MTSRTTCVIAVAIAIAIAAAPSARADEIAVLDGQRIDEIAHTVDVRVADGVARYVVQRQFRNRGKRPEELRLTIELPSGAAATGMRARVAGAWRSAELLDAALATARYQYVAGAGAGADAPTDLALLSWVSANQLVFHVFPVPPGAVSTVEYTLTAPARYSGGQYWATYPRTEPAPRSGRARSKLVDPIVTVHATAPAIVDGKPATGPVAIARRTLDERSRGSADGNFGTSAIDVPASPLAARRHAVARIAIALEHVDRGELSFELVTPTGVRVPFSTDGDDVDVALPAAERAAGRWRLVSAPGAQPGLIARWTLSIGGATYRASDTPAFIPSATDGGAAHAVIRVAAPVRAPWAARLGRVVASHDRAFARLELDAAPQLSALPIGAQVVFVLDASYSAGAEHLAAQLAIVRAYLAHVPDAQFEVIAVRRTAQRLFGQFVAARDADRHLAAAIQRGALALGNGSALDAGAALAAAILAGRAGPQRVVIATDERLRSSLGDATASLAALAPTAVVHVVAPESGAGLTRDDAAPLAPLALRHRGIFARIESEPEQPSDLAPLALGLVRPTRIEHLTGPSGFALPSELREGEGLRIVDENLTAATAPAHVTLTGALWSDPIRVDATASRVFSTATAALLIGADQLTALEESEVRTIAFAAGAISSVSSYLAAAPGPGPSTPDLGAELGSVWTTVGLGGASASSSCIGHVLQVHSPRLDLGALLDPQRCLRQHPGGASSVQLSIETTGDEIVDVKIARGTGPLADCLVETAWEIRLDARFTAERETFVVDLGAR